MQNLPLMLLVGFFFQAEDGIRYIGVTGVQPCALPISRCTFVRDTNSLPPTAKVGPARMATRSMPEIGRASCRERVTTSGAPVSSSQYNGDKNVARRAKEIECPSRTPTPESEPWRTRLM